MNAHSSAPSRGRNQPRGAGRYLLTALTLLGIAVVTVGVISWLSRPPKDMSGTPVPPPSVPEPTAASPASHPPPDPAPERVTLSPGWDSVGTPSPDVSPSRQFSDVTIRPNRGKTSWRLLHNDVGLVDGTKWEAIDAPFPVVREQRRRTRLRGGSLPAESAWACPDGVVDEEILIVFDDQKYAKRFMGAMRSAISSL